MWVRRAAGSVCSALLRHVRHPVRPAHGLGHRLLGAPAPGAIGQTAIAQSTAPLRRHCRRAWGPLGAPIFTAQVKRPPVLLTLRGMLLSLRPHCGRAHGSGCAGWDGGCAQRACAAEHLRLTATL